MSEAKHTPGDDVAEANARLIAAAPELLEALKAFVKYTRPYIPVMGVYSSPMMREWVDGILPTVEAAEAAIAKAEGRTP